MRDDTIRQVEQFLYREARMLDDRKFHEWLEILADDIRYLSLIHISEPTRPY